MEIFFSSLWLLTNIILTSAIGLTIGMSLAMLIIKIKEKHADDAGE